MDTGKTIAHYTILRPLGKGGMGEVYLDEARTSHGYGPGMKNLQNDIAKSCVDRNNNNFIELRCFFI